MPLFAKSFQELVAASLEDLSINTNITKLSAGGIARALLEAMNRRLSEAYDVFDLNLARAFVSSAPGEYLELIGELLGTPKLASVAASADADTEVIKFYVESGIFGDINGGNDIIVPQGHIISTGTGNTGILYRTIAQTRLSATDGSEWVSAIAVSPGEESHVGINALNYHDFTDYTDYLNNTLLVTNMNQIANGRNFENDANYRFRIVNKVLEAEAANLTAIRLAILSTPGVADVILIPRYRGIGTCGAILQSTLPTVSQTLIDSVTASVSKVQALGDISYIRAPKETGVTLKTTVYYDARYQEEILKDIEDQLKTTITEFINNLDIGESLFINRLASELFAVSSSIVNLGIPGKPFDEIYIHVESRLGDNKVRQKLLADYVPEDDERIIIEPSYTTPIVLTRAYTRR